MKITRDFKPLSDRYSFDCGPCSYANGFAQIDTKPGWRRTTAPGARLPATRTIVNFCEGDVTTTVCETDAELRRAAPGTGQVERRSGLRPDEDRRRIHGDELRQAFETLGLADLLH